MKKDFGKQFRKFASALEKIDAEKIYLDSVKKTESLALDLNRSQLYDQGIDSSGKPLGKYSEGTKKQKAKKGQRSDHITLSDTFEFYDRMFIDTKKTPIFIESKAEVAPILLGKFPNALGLTSQSKEDYGKAVLIEYKHGVAKQIESLKEKILS